MPPFLSLHMKKEIGVKLFINDKEIPINGTVASKYDENGNLIVTFSMGKTKLDRVKLIFDKRSYLDIEDE